MQRVGKGRVGSGQGRKKGRVGSGSKNKVDPRVGKAGHFVKFASVLQEFSEICDHISSEFIRKFVRIEQSI